MGNFLFLIMNETSLLILWIVFVLLAIVLPLLRFTDSDYPFGIFKLFSYPVTHKTNIMHPLMN